MDQANPSADFRYVRGFISPSEEQQLFSFVQTQAHWGFIGKKRRLSFGWNYGVSKKTLKRGQPIPPILEAISKRLYEDGLMDALAEQVVVQEYQPGQGIGPHIDLQPEPGGELHTAFGPVVVSVSMLSPCLMRFSHPDKRRGLDVTLEPRSALAISGEMRSEWRHEIVASTVRDLRMSVTFRTVIVDLGSP